MDGEESAADGEGWRHSRRPDDSTTRPAVSLNRVRSPLDAEVQRLITRIMDCAFTVHRHLGPGFRERIYERVFCLELDAAGLPFECEKPIEVGYRHWRIPGQIVDLLIDQRVLVEVKTVPRFRPIPGRRYSRISRHSTFGSGF